MRRAIPIALGLVTAGAGGLTAALVRAGRRSGVTRAELDRALPGDDLVPGARVLMDRAATLPAPPELVWPWLVQLGRERAGWYLPGVDRAAIAIRFHALIAATAIVRSESSCSLNCCFTDSYTLSGTWVSLMRVTASVHASAARSRAE